MKTSYLHDTQYIAKLKSIEQQINQNKLQDAVLQLNTLAKTSAHDPRLFLLGSRLAEASGNPDGQLQAARKAHQLAPHWPTATIHLATVLASRGEAEEAISLAELALQQTTTQTTQVSSDPQLLVQAAAVAQRLELHSQALHWLRQADQVSPGDFNIRYKIGLALSASGDADSAIDIFTDLLLQKPGNSALLRARMQACMSAQQSAAAIRDGEALLAIEPDNERYQFYLAIARGETPKTQPAAIVTDLFDSFASRFDRHWVVQLQYKLPRDVAQMINQWHPDRQCDVLDLGCGTGLLGACLGRMEGVLVGVDLSGEMMAQAGQHHVYDRFHHVNLLDALQDTPGNLYHVISALDVLNYVGCLDSVIPNAYRILLPGGRFVFSCEAGSDGAAKTGPGYALQSTLRYTHQLSYLQRLLDEAGFKDIDIQTRVLRNEAEQPVQGYLVTARKPLLVAKKTARRSPKSAKTASPAQ